jgi:hypothetical protein
MTTDSGRSPVPDLWLERLRLGELAPADARALEDRLRHDPEARARLEAIDRDDREQRAARLPHRIATAARQRIAARGPDVHRPRVRTLTVAAAGAACLLAVAAVIVRSPQLPGTSPDDGDGDRLKGTGPAIVAFRKAGDTSAPLRDGDTARERDVIRLGYQSAGRAFGAIVSIDGRGVVTQHLPVSGTTAVRLAASGVALLDAAYELDDAPRFERFCLVTSDRPFDVGVVLDAARTAARGTDAPLSVPRLDVTCLTLRKDRQ